MFSGRKALTPTACPKMQMSFRGEAATEECEWKLLRECVKCQWILERKKPLWNVPWN